MAEFLLVHGSCFGAWCWHRLFPELARLGHAARAIDLPRYQGVRLEDQARAICAQLTTSTILVGHSAGGFPITAAAEQSPGQIRALVWLCAYIPEDGSSVASLRRRQTSQPLRPAIRVDRATGSYSFSPESLNSLFFHDCGPEDRHLAASRLSAEAIAPQKTPIRLTSRSRNLPKFAITCEDDRAIPTISQHEMARNLPPQNRFTLNCGHAPFFAKPAETAALLDQIARTIT